MPDNKTNVNDATIAEEVIGGRSESDSIIRTGSPFATGSVAGTSIPPQTIPPQTIPPDAITAESPRAEVLTDGVMNYTAKGSATASLMVIFFAAAAAWWFPAGGILIAGLGCGLAVGGMFSDYRLPSAGLLVVHLGLFFASYTMAIR